MTGSLLGIMAECYTMAGFSARVANLPGVFMKAFFDYLPVLVFFAVYFLTGQNLMQATWGILIASSLQVVLGRLILKRFDQLHLLIFFITLVFGGLTVAFQDESFIKWRHTISSLTLATILFVGHFFERNFIERLVNTFSKRALGFSLTLRPIDWRIINLACVIYFIAVALLNLYIAFNFSTRFWVNFSLFGFGGIQLVFFALIMLFIYKRLPEEDRQRLHQSQQGAAQGHATQGNHHEDN
jgi:intracellular septation protein